MTQEAQTVYLSDPSGRLVEMKQAAPWLTGGFSLLMIAFLLYCGFGVVAARRRIPGRWLTLSGLAIIALCFIFQITLAQDAKLRHSSMGEALCLIVYGSGGLMVAIGYARAVLRRS
jgi:hypothetical protein